MERTTKSIEKEMEEEKNLTDYSFKFSIPEVCPCSLKDLTNLYMQVDNVKQALLQTKRS